MQAVEIIPDKLFFVSLRRPDGLSVSPIARKSLCFSVDNELLFEPFFAEFGPLNLGLAYRFCEKLTTYLKEGEKSGRHVYYYCSAHPHQIANASVLIGMYQVLVLGRTTDEAYSYLTGFKPFVPFRDASCGVATFHLTVYDCIKGIQKARDVGFLNFLNNTFDVEEYQYYEQVEHGDLNWIIPGKFVAFSGPASKRTEYYGYCTLVPEDYTEYYKHKGVTGVVRLNKKAYDRRRFTDSGLHHYDLFFPDGSCPPEQILKRFLEIAENEPGALAVHCKAGLGRTGVLICCYMMKHFGFTAEECIGYIRICRPGSVIGPQQHFLRDMQARMWREGDLYRQRQAASLSSSSRSSSASSSERGSQRGSCADLPEMERRTSPMKSLRSGTKPTIMASLTRQLAGTSLHGKSSDGTQRGQSGGRYSAYAGGSSVDTSAYEQRYATNSGRSASQGSVGFQRSRISAVSMSSPAFLPPRRDVGYVTQMTAAANSTRYSTPNLTSQPAQWSKFSSTPGTNDGRSASAAIDGRPQAPNGLRGFQITAATPMPKPSSSVSRMLAPNGQPRKVPTAIAMANSKNRIETGASFTSHSSQGIRSSSRARSYSDLQQGKSRHQ